MPECSVPSCTRASRDSGARGGRILCVGHLDRVVKHGDVDAGRPLGQRRKRPEPKVGPYGYIELWAPDHPAAQKNGRVKVHRMVMSDHLGRPLLPTEEVHHRNGDRADNRLANLELWSRSQPPGQRVVDKVRWAREIIELYGDLADA